ncbi:MAG: aspartate carbamoyltransferase, partial [Candidatus Jacksonbacteria bacterium]|nr:aspartate carbamoyltransferase [Candidatus Jacksonbacteria bacterium]
RAPRSLIQALAVFPDVHLVLVAPDALQLDDDLVQYLDEMGTSYEMTDDLQAALHLVAIVYMTRLQLERVPDDQRLFVQQIYHRFCLNLAMLQGTSVHTVMHPLPRVDELSLDLDNDPRAAWNEQASYGVAVRMALILMLFGKLPLELDL